MFGVKFSAIFKMVVELTSAVSKFLKAACNLVHAIDLHNLSLATVAFKQHGVVFLLLPRGGSHVCKFINVNENVNMCVCKIGLLKYTDKTQESSCLYK